MVPARYLSGVLRPLPFHGKQRPDPRHPSDQPCLHHRVDDLIDRPVCRRRFLAQTAIQLGEDVPATTDRRVHGIDGSDYPQIGCDPRHRPRLLAGKPPPRPVRR